MQGFIELTQQNGKAFLLPIEKIESIYPQDSGTLIYTKDAGYHVDNSYEEVKRRLNSLFT